MILQEQIAYDAAVVWVNPIDFGEEAEHEAADGTRTRVPSAWAPVELLTLEEGFVADRSRVVVPRAAVRAVVRGELLRRRPDRVDALLLEDGFALLYEDGAEVGAETSGAERWEVETVEEGPAAWSLVCLRSLRPAPRGR